jgi:hypothetical protein
VWYFVLEHRVVDQTTDCRNTENHYKGLHPRGASRLVKKLYLSEAKKGEPLREMSSGICKIRN